MPNVHDQAARGALVARMNGIRADSSRKWGRMTADQMAWHVNAQLEAALGKRPCGRLDNWFKRTLLKQVALHGPWPKGKAPTAPEMRATGEYDLEAEKRRFAELLEELSRRGLDVEWARHPAFGPLSGREWSRLAWRHADHHLKQFSA